MGKVYEVLITKKIEEKIFVEGCGTRAEAMAAAIGSAKQDRYGSSNSRASDFCVKEIKEIFKKVRPS